MTQTIPPTAVITVIRSSQYTNKGRAIDIYVDDIQIGKVRDGETKIFPIQSGNHVLFTKIDFAKCNSLPFSLDSGQDKAFRLMSPFKGKQFLNPFGGFAAILKPAGWITIEEVKSA
jgi:hypothetical protein